MCLLVYCFVYLRGEVGLVHIHVIFVDSLCFFSFTASEHVREDLYGTGSGLELIIYVRSWPYSCLWRIAWPVPASVYVQRRP